MKQTLAIAVIVLLICASIAAASYFHQLPDIIKAQGNKAIFDAAAHAQRSDTLIASLVPFIIIGVLVIVVFVLGVFASMLLWDKLKRNQEMPEVIWE